MSGTEARDFRAWRLLEEAAAHDGVSIGQLCETARLLEQPSALDSLPSATPSLQSSLSDVEAQAAREGRELRTLLVRLTAYAEDPQR